MVAITGFLARSLPIATWYPTAHGDWTNIGRWIGGEARAALGLPGMGSVALDGLVSLWQVAP